ncbi:MAG: septum formation protein Maf [Planctomycetes bacterium]|nr:septum formation protein Maf [Planctomycetota bacterium]
MPSTLILASTSRYRRALMERLGLPFTALAPACDEDALKDSRLAPQALAEFLAEAKATSIAQQQPDAVVIGSDQLAAVEVAGAWTILGKPGTAAKAVDQLALLSGRTHVLITAMVVARGTERWRHTDVTRLTMRRLDRAVLERYVAADQPLDCAGAYKLECRGITLFDTIDSQDASAITGLPLLALTRILAGLGYAIP